MNLLVDNELCEYQITLVEDRIVVFVIHCSIHQRVRANKVEYRVRKARGVINTSAWTRLGNLRVENGQPSRVWCRLLLKLSCRRKEANKGSIKYRQGKVFHFRTLFFLTSKSELSCSVLPFFSILIEKAVNTLERISCSRDTNNLLQPKSRS